MCLRCRRSWHRNRQLSVVGLLDVCYSGIRESSGVRFMIPHCLFCISSEFDSKVGALRLLYMLATPPTGGIAKASLTDLFKVWAAQG